MADYILSYTGEEIDEKLSKVIIATLAEVKSYLGI